MLQNTLLPNIATVFPLYRCKPDRVFSSFPSHTFGIMPMPLSITQFLLLLNGSGGVPAISSLFEGAGDEVGIYRADVLTVQHYYMCQHLGNRLYWRIHVSGTNGIGNEYTRIADVGVYRLWRGFNDQSAGVTLSGTWSTSLSGAYLGGRARFSNVVGNYAEIVTPNGVQRASLQSSGPPSAGMALVTIDGDRTRATLLPTAQDLVDGGTLASTALVANGGTLNPTDRIWDGYLSSAVDFADDLAAAAHTIRITVTGYKRAASSNTFVLFTAFVLNGDAVFGMADPFYYFTLIQQTISYGAPPVWEISYNNQPTGATAKEWLGHTGSLKHQAAAPIFTVDGTPQTIANLATYTGLEIAMSQGLDGRHSEIGAGATDIADLQMTIRINATTGFWISHTLTWLINGIVNGFPMMMTFNANVFDTCRAIDNTDEILTNNDNSQVANTLQNQMLAWDSDGNQGLLFYIPDLLTTVNNWEDTTDYQLYVLDQSDGVWEKAYATRVANGTMSNGEIWQAEANYRAQWFVDADEVLSSA
jgi:hypothetical protein